MFLSILRACRFVPALSGALILLVGALGTGCASYRSAGGGSASNRPGETRAEPQRIAIKMSRSAAVDGAPSKSFSGVAKIVNEQTQAVYKENGFAVDWEDENGSTRASSSGICAQIHFHEDGDSNKGGAVLCGLTFTLVPVKATTELTLTTKFIDAEGRNLGTITKTETLSTWIGFFCLFAMPGHTGGTVTTSILHDLNQATIAEARKMKIL